MDGAEWLKKQERIGELKLQLKGIIEELRTLSGDIVPDFNDVWGGAGPDCKPNGRDWTAIEEGSSNASPEFVYLVGEVGKLIRGSSHSLIRGNTDGVARLIMAQLAHVHHLAPIKEV